MTDLTEPFSRRKTPAHSRTVRVDLARWCRLLPAILLFPIGLALPAGESGADSSNSQEELNRAARSLLSDRCFKCHGFDEKGRKARLRLDLAGEVVRPEGRDRVAIQPGDPGASEVIRRIESDDPDEVMPPPDSNLRLSDDEKALLRRWIASGARFEEHWSFTKIRRPPVPPVRLEGWARNAVDRFVLAGLEARGLEPSPEASRATLIRRVHLTLLGLPPSPRDVEQYLEDRDPGAYERMVDRVLADPAFGERLAWDWLEAARYADSNGYQGDRERTMWPWRDWVVRALNRNQPLDEFTVWQLAGDRLPGATHEQRLATGFARNHMINGEGGRIPEENRVEYVMDMAETVGTVWLGLTFNCCRCHDHKFDPLAQSEYFSLFAFFNQTPVTGAGGDPQTPPALEAPTLEQRRVEAGLITLVREREEKLTEAETAWRAGPGIPESLPEKVRQSLAKSPRERSTSDLGEQLQHLEKLDVPPVASLRSLLDSRKKLEAHRKGYPRVMVLEDRPERRKTHILTTGLYNKPTVEVSAGVPACLPPLETESEPDRLDLARWIVSRENPLASRVTVNRLWQRFFGRGLVKTVEDFGSQGERPSHPGLLDWLSSELLEEGWDLKNLCRTIVTSATFRQSSRWSSPRSAEDPENRWLSRGPRFRLSSWILRDQALASSGLLARELGGPPVQPYQPAGVWAEATFGNKKYRQDHGEALYRRSLYVFWRRIVGPTIFFDESPRQYCSVKMTRTNTPLHALTTLNSIAHVEAARALAFHALEEVGEGPAREVVRAQFRRVLVREPSPEELDHLETVWVTVKKRFEADPEQARLLLRVGERRLPERHPPVDLAAWTAVGNLILNLDETLNLE